MKPNTKLLIAGIVAVIFSIWGFCFCIHLLPAQWLFTEEDRLWFAHWWSLPTFATLLFFWGAVFLAGFAAIAVGMD